MKKLVFAAVVLFVTLAHAQLPPEDYNHSNELAKMINIPGTPEAEAFSQYGNTPVNLFTGTPNIEVPIYVHDGLELDLPISLTYDASGIKVSQLPTTVGLGWNLNAGGRISRRVSGSPDSYILGPLTQNPYDSWYDPNIYSTLTDYLNKPPLQLFGPGPTFTGSSGPDDANDYLEFLLDMHKNLIETQPDLYEINVMGLSETFVLKPTTTQTAKEAIPLKNPRIDIAYTTSGGILNDASDTITEFTVTSDNGTQYTFEVMERATTVTNTGDLTIGGPTTTYNSGWFLTQIVSPTGADVYTFNYGNYASRDEIPSVTLTQRTDMLISSPLQPDGSPAYLTSDTEYRGVGAEPRKSLTSITHNGMEIAVFTYDATFDDGPDTALVKIDIFDQTGSDYEQKLYKTFDLNQSYFNDGVYDPTDSQDHNKVRLRLDGIDISGSLDANEDPVVVKQYGFEYHNPDGLPPLTSMAQDYLGYYNGVLANTEMYVGDPYNHPYVDNGGNRNPSFLNSQKGLLRKIIYPTGGYSIFTYEADAVTSTETIVSNDWQQLIDFSHTESNLPAQDNTVCNLSSSNGGITPSVGISAAFEVTMDDQNHRVIYSHTDGGGGGGVIAEEDFKAYLVKVSGPTAPLSWSDIFDSSCGVKPGIEIAWSLTSDWIDLPASQQVVSLSEGWYKVVLPIHFSDDVKQVIVEEPVTTTSSQTVENPRAGIRIKNIRDFDKGGDVASFRSYTYTGVELTPIEQHYTLVEQYNQLNQGIGLFHFDLETRLYRPAHFNNTNKPHVGYTQVTETVKDASGNSNYGSTTYRFEVGSSYNLTSGIYRFRQPNEIGASTNFRSYKPNGTQAKMTQPGYEEETLEYSAETEVETIMGGYLSANPRHNYHYPVVSTTSGTTRIDLHIAQEVTVGGNSQLDEPDQGQTEGDFFKQEIARLVLRPQYIRAHTGANVAKVETREHTPDGSVISLSEYTYKSNDLVLSTTLTDSKGDTYSSTMYYPDDLTGSGYDYLESKNRISIPVKEVFKKGTDVLSVRLSEYYDGTTGNKKGMLKLIETAKGSDNAQDLESRLEVVQYDAKKKVREAHQSDGASVAYIWGYDNRYLVAQIKDATWTDVDNALSSLSTNYPAVQNLEGSALENVLTGVRGYFSDRLVTTYTYDPSVGMTSVTDPSGVKTTYHYDDFNRLQYIKDFNGDILKEIGYNTLNVVVTDPTDDNHNTPYTAAGMTISESDNFGDPKLYGNINSVSGGSGQGFDYVWSFQLPGMQYPQIFHTGDDDPDFDLIFSDYPNLTFCQNEITLTCVVTDQDPLNTANSVTVQQTYLINCTF